MDGTRIAKARTELGNDLPQRRKLPHTPPPWVADSAVYFITICTLPRNRDQLCHPAAAEALFESIEFNAGRGIWWPRLVLLMPDHLHALMCFAPVPGMKKAISDWKHFTGRKLRLNWQRDFFDHRLRTGDSLEEKAAYIRRNPVRAGLAEEPQDWPYVRDWHPFGRVEQTG
jgi:putative transposase